MAFLIAGSPETNTADEIFKETLPGLLARERGPTRHGGCCPIGTYGRYWFMKHARNAAVIAVRAI
jgi:hypothetical protein